MADRRGGYLLARPGVYHLLTKDSRKAATPATLSRVWRVRVMSLAAFHSMLVVAIGFAVAGLLAASYQLITTRPPDFALLNGGPRPTTLASIPFLIFAAPYIILRSTIHAGIEGQKFIVVTLATILVGFWSLMCGTVVVMALQALGSIFT